VDLSIAPRVARAAPFLAAVAIGERGADLIAADLAARGPSSRHEDHRGVVAAPGPMS
jgi:hypothetical protein